MLNPFLASFILNNQIFLNLFLCLSVTSSPTYPLVRKVLPSLRSYHLVFGLPMETHRNVLQGERLLFRLPPTSPTCTAEVRSTVVASECGHDTPDAKRGFFRSGELFILSCPDALHQIGVRSFPKSRFLYATYLSSVI